MRGIIAVGGYVPHHRLDRSEITAFFVMAATSVLYSIPTQGLE